MRTIDLSSLKNNDSEYEKLIDSATDSYKGDWDDQIHDSYLRYLKQIQEQSRTIHVI